MLNQQYTKKWLAVMVLACLTLAGCFGHKKTATAGTAGSSAEPDKILFDRASDDIKHSRYPTARLALQTLINTYPDSEYLAKAKLAIADSYFKEGGTTGLTQAVAEYQDFITFFPFLDESAYAQMQIGMAHYHEMEKPDRDRTEAEQAEAAFQTFLQKYPNSELHAKAEQDLRNVQEVLAEGDYRIAYFYYFRRADRAAASRLAEMTSRYPLYSQADRANWMLAQVYERNEHADVAAQFYARIARDYPLSPLAADSKAKLAKLNVPVPQPDPTALARMQQEQQLPRPRNGVVGRSLGMLRTAPDMSTAARTGAPTLTPPEDNNNDALTVGGAPTVGVTPSGGATTGTLVEIVSPGSPGATPPGGSAPAGTAAGSAAGANGATGNAAATVQAGDPPAQAAGTSSSTDAPTPAQPAGSTSSSAGKESSSKKKKGLRKVIPF